MSSHIAGQYNQVATVRPEPTFDNYQPYTESQEQALQLFKAIGSELVKSEQALIGPENPIPKGRLIILSGSPGVGKTHLIEALINEIKAKAPELLSQIYLLRGTPLGYVTSYDAVSYGSRFKERRIIIIDDLFSQKSSARELNDAVDVKPLASLVMGA